MKPRAGSADDIPGPSLALVDMAREQTAPVDEPVGRSRIAHDGCMTIASHCIDLLRANGPMTREQLGESCRVAGVTVAKDPALSVQSALRYDGRTLCVDGRYHLVERVLDGRWLTLERPENPQKFDPDIDLKCLEAMAQKDGVPLASGGHLKQSTYYGGGWSGPADWAPPGEVIGIRLVAGVAHVSSVDVDDDVRQRGEQLVPRLEERIPTRSYALDRRHTAAGDALLMLLHEDDDVLRQPVPPLSRLFPAPEPDTHRYRPAGTFATTTLRVPLAPEVYAGLAEAADYHGVSVDTWVADELTRLYAWPHRPWFDRYGRAPEPWLEDDEVECHDRALSLVRPDHPGW